MPLEQRNNADQELQEAQEASWVDHLKEFLQQYFNEGGVFHDPEFTPPRPENPPQAFSLEELIGSTAFLNVELEGEIAAYHSYKKDNFMDRRIMLAMSFILFCLAAVSSPLVLAESSLNLSPVAAFASGVVALACGSSCAFAIGTYFVYGNNLKKASSVFFGLMQEKSQNLVRNVNDAFARFTMAENAQDQDVAIVSEFANLLHCRLRELIIMRRELGKDVGPYQETALGLEGVHEHFRGILRTRDLAEQLQEADALQVQIGGALQDNEPSLPEPLAQQQVAALPRGPASWRHHNLPPLDSLGMRVPSSVRASPQLAETSFAAAAAPDPQRTGPTQEEIDGKKPASKNEDFYSSTEEPLTTQTSLSDAEEGAALTTQTSLVPASDRPSPSYSSPEESRRPSRAPSPTEAHRSQREGAITPSSYQV